MSIFLSDNVGYFWHAVVAILVDKTLGLFCESINSLWGPPRNRVTGPIILSALIIKAVCNFMSDHNSDSTIVQISGKIPYMISVVELRVDG